MIRRPPTPPLFPYTTLFRSALFVGAGLESLGGEDVRRLAQLLVGPLRLLRLAQGRLEAQGGVLRRGPQVDQRRARDRKSTRLNSSHVAISYAVFCLKQKTEQYSQA